MISLTIDGIKTQVEKGTTILEAAKSLGVSIPTLCQLQEINHTPGACRVCVVEVDRSKSLVAACVYPVAEGLKVKTNSLRVQKARHDVVEFLLSDHPQECTVCQKNGQCELQTLAEMIGVRQISIPQSDFSKRTIDDSSPSLVRDPAKCINCLRCVAVCTEVQGVALLTPKGRGFESKVVPALDKTLLDSACVFCGQCSLVCPTGAIVEKDDTAKVWAALNDPTKHVIVQEAPAIRGTLGEEFGMPPGTLVTGKMIAALRRLGFAKVFDTNFSADLTIIEEGNELLHRVETQGALPLLTSCSPGWIKFVEHFYPELIPNLSTCKSPQQMFGALAKTYYAQEAGIPAQDIFVVSIMPCTAKKFEAARPEMCASGYRDVDAVLTTRELARMIRQAGINFAALLPEEFDAPMGQYSGAGTIFGATGGVMEAALRTVYAVVTGESMPSLDILPVRGLEGVKSAALKVGKLGEVKVAVAHGLGNARRLLEAVKQGKETYHFIEIMACPGGCVGGGGQTIPVTNDLRRLRASALYFDDRSVQTYRQSHENPAIQALYQKFLEKPLSHKSHELLHTHYWERGI